MKELSNKEVQAVNGAHGTGLVMTILGIPHVIMGFIEFYNYTYDWVSTGCSTCEDDDHFKKTICGITSND